MTILQKMLLVPCLSLILYSSFAYYSYTEQQQNNETIALLSDQYAPLLDKVNQNRQLFDRLRTTFKDAVLAVELSWLPQTSDIRADINENLQSMQEYSAIIQYEDIVPMRENVNAYFENAQQLAINIISKGNVIEDNTALIEDVERYHNLSAQQFKQVEIDIKKRFENTIKTTREQSNRLQLLSSVISIGLLLFLLLMTFYVAFSTYLQVKQVIMRMRELALGGSDFSQRLEREQRDELGYLIYWFNKLSDKLEQSYKQLETVSITDKLTQLNNRHRTDEYLKLKHEQLKAGGSSFSVALMDVDHFKNVNDTYGHGCGDSVLQLIASILKEHAESHTFVGRWGGEEFIIVHPVASIESLNAYLEALRLKIENAHFPDIKNVTVSIGAAVVTQLHSANESVKQADDALYEAKGEGRNQVVISNR